MPTWKNLSGSFNTIGSKTPLQINSGDKTLGTFPEIRKEPHFVFVRRNRTNTKKIFCEKTTWLRFIDFKYSSAYRMEEILEKK
jgi:hypothetical protein